MQKDLIPNLIYNDREYNFYTPGRIRTASFFVPVLNLI